MKVLVFGNIGSGKTTLAKAISSQYLRFQLLSIDDFRRKYGDGSMEAERIAKNAFVDAVLQDADQIIEATGCGDTAERLYNVISRMNEKLAVIVLLTPLNTCMARLESRIWNVPYPAPTEQAHRLAAETDLIIQSGSIQSLWATIPTSSIINLPSVNQEDLDQVLNKLQSIITL